MISEILAGLTAANQATQLLKELREIDQSVDEAAFKLKIAEITETFADTKIALSEARVALAERDAEISKLQAALEAARSGDLCPKCGSGKMAFQSERKHPIWGAHGKLEQTLRCTNEACGHTREVIFDPNSR